jgi:hypothetical protein
MARSHCPPADLTSPQPPQGCVQPLVFHLQMKCTVRLNPIATKIDAQKCGWRQRSVLTVTTIPIFENAKPDWLSPPRKSDA